MSKRSPCEKTSIGNLVPFFQGPEWSPRLTCRKKDKDTGKDH